MSQLMSDLTPDEWIELVGLLASISGILVIGASLIAKGVARATATGDRLKDVQGRAPILYAAILRRGICHLACGGGCFTLAELVEVLSK